jgi:hypothetical protein
MPAARALSWDGFRAYELKMPCNGLLIGIVHVSAVSTCAIEVCFKSSGIAAWRTSAERKETGR